MAKWLHREINKQTRERDRQTEIERDGQTDRLRERERHRQTDRQTKTERVRKLR